MTTWEEFTKDLKTLIAIAEAILVGFSKENDKEMLTEFFKSLISKWELEKEEKNDIPLRQAWGTNDLMVTAAHRYCLGRRSYIVSVCVDWLIENWDLFHQETKKRIIEETKEAIERGRAGDDYDVLNWQKLIQIEQKMTPREEFEKELRELLTYAYFCKKRFLAEELDKESLINFIEKWGPKSDT